MDKRIQANAGFSLIELIAVMVILSALSALLVPRWSPGDSTVPAQADRLARDLRHTQALAMSLGRTLTLDIQSTGSYRIADAGTTLMDPAGGLLNINLLNGVTVAGNDIDFDSLGRPLSGGALLNSSQSWTVNGSANSANVALQPVTGFIAVTP